MINANESRGQRPGIATDFRDCTELASSRNLGRAEARGAHVRAPTRACMHSCGHVGHLPGHGASHTSPRSVTACFFDGSKELSIVFCCGRYWHLHWCWCCTDIVCATWNAVQCFALSTTDTWTDSHRSKLTTGRAEACKGRASNQLLQLLAIQRLQTPVSVAET